MKGVAFTLFAISALALIAIGQGATETSRTLFADASTNAANYAFTTTTSGTSTDMSSGTTQLVAAGTNDVSSVVTNLPFAFYMLGAKATQFSASSNGYIQLGGTAISPTQYLLGNGLLITALGSDLQVSSSGKIHYKVTGAAPNRVLTIEFLNMTIIYGGGAPGGDGTYQVRLYETTGVIEFVYGPMNRNSSLGANRGLNAQYIGFSIASTANNFVTVNTANMVNTTGTPTANQFPLDAPMPSLNSPIEGSRRTYTFTPPIPTAPTNLTFTDVTLHSMTLHWVDAPDEQSYEIYRSTDGINYSFITTRSQNSTVYATPSDLAPGTTYFWKIYSVSEGAVSNTALSGSQMTTTAGTVTVTNLSDSGAGSLRQALVDVEDGGTIIFAPFPGGNANAPSVFTITLTGGSLVINKSMTISGPGANLITVQRDAAAAPFRIFYVTFGLTVALDGLTISNGFAQGPNALDKVGGGIFNNSSILTVNRCVLSGNMAAGASPFGGGGIYSSSSGGPPTATLTVANCTLNGNSAPEGFGGAISNAGNAVLRVVNSTLSDNSASSSGGGGIDSDANVGGGGIVTVSNSTLIDNSGAANIVNAGNALQIGNTILKRGISALNITNINGSIVSLGYNLSDDHAGGFFNGNGDQINTNPFLGPLKNNGGPTPTHAPLSNSPAIDRGKDIGLSGNPTGQDERGSARPVTYDVSITPPSGGDRSDIGAVELQPGVIPTSAVSRKTQGAAGDFDIILPLNGPVGIECRSGGATNDYKIVVTFAAPVTFSSAAVNDGAGSVVASSGSGTNTLAVDLTGVTTAQRITLALFDVNDGTRNGDLAVRMGALVGDTNGSGSVNASDINQVKGVSGLPVSGSNFRGDVTANGVLNSADINLVKSRSGTTLPP
ncbi:MAG: choice-of-anchor Q domain-containing protein [Verrucomicrobiota bacterium]